jgi:hypothetical protein
MLSSRLRTGPDTLLWLTFHPLAGINRAMTLIFDEAFFHIAMALRTFD